MSLMKPCVKRKTQSLAASGAPNATLRCPVAICPANDGEVRWERFQKRLYINSITFTIYDNDDTARQEAKTQEMLGQSGVAEQSNVMQQPAAKIQARLVTDRL